VEVNLIGVLLRKRAAETVVADNVVKAQAADRIAGQSKRFGNDVFDAIWIKF
jgi:hypothetical protein